MQLNNISQNPYLMYQNKTAAPKAQSTPEVQQSAEDKAPFNPLLSKYIIKQSS